jgi:hypothetical protein
LHRSKLTVISIVVLLLFSLSIGLAVAQNPYVASKTTDVAVGSNGLFVASEPSVGVMYTIEGTPGAVGTVTTVVFSGNPQAIADVPSGVSLSHFIAITFDMNAEDFTRATVIVSYNDNELAGMDEPYFIYKYLPSSDSYVALTTDVDTTAKTMTVILTSVDDPILAIGGLTAEPVTGDLTTVWVVVVVAVVVVVVLAVLLVLRRRRM